MSSCFAASFMMELGISFTWETVTLKSIARFMDDVAVLLLKKVKDIPEDALVDISGAKVSLYSFSFPISFCASPTSWYCQ